MILKKNKNFAFLALGLTVSLFSCDPDKVDPKGQDEQEEPIAVNAPTVSLELSGNAEKLHNEVTLTLTAEEDDVIEKVEFFLNDESLGTDEEEPYETVWNTKESEDGNYVLKAVASNASETGTATQEVTVENTLLTVHVEDNPIPIHPDNKRDSWAYLSDQNGNVLGEAQQLESGSSLSFERPSDFNDDIIYLNRVEYLYTFREHQTIPYESLSILTYSNLPLDEVVLMPHRQAQNDDPIGQVAIAVENDFDGTQKYEYNTRTNNFRAQVNESTSHRVSYSLNMKENTEKGMSTYETMWWPDKVREREKYIRFDDFEIGSEYKFHTSEYEAMEGQTLTMPVDYNSLMISSKGVTADNELFQIDFLFSMVNENKEFEFFHTDLLTTVNTTISGSLGDKYFFTNTRGKAPNVISIPDYSATVTPDGMNSFQVETQGTFDIGAASWRHNVSNESESYYINRRVYFSNKSNTTYAVPNIPEELLELYPKLNEQMDNSSTYLLDNEDLSSYEDIIKLWLTDEFRDKDYDYATSLNLYPKVEEEGGRIMGGKDVDQMRRQAEESQLRAKGMF